MKKIERKHPTPDEYVDGALIGGASLDADEFVAIARFRLHPAAE